MKMLSRLLSPLLLFIIVCSSNAATSFKLNPLFNFGSTATPARFDGSIQPGDTLGVSPYTGYPVLISSGGAPNFPLASNVWYVNPGNASLNETNVDPRPSGSTNGFNMRGLAFDKVSSNLIFVDTHVGSGGGETNSRYAGLYILDGNTGALLSGLNTNGIVEQAGTGVGGYPIVCAGAADDGVIYVCSQTLNSATRALKIYRWTTADTNNPGFGQPPVVAFTNVLGPSIGTSGERIGQTMDVRGAGTNTQIILGTSSLNGTGTNIFLFTTADGTNFSPVRISFPGVITTAVFNDGIAFGPSNTFFAKQVGKPFLYMAYSSTNGYDPIPGNQISGTVISSFTASSFNDPMLNISAIAYDPINKLIGGLEEIGGIATGGRGKVWLFDAADPTNRAPVVLDSRQYVPNFQKTTAPMGYICFRYGTNLYAQASNNGLLATAVGTVTLNAPTFTTDLPSSTRAPIGAGVHFEVFAVVDVTNYVWYSNNVVIAGVNTYYYDIPTNTPAMDGWVFKVVAFNAAGSTTSTLSTLSVVNPANFFHAVKLWATNANSIALSDPKNFITANGGSGTPNERTLAYNALSNQLLICRGPSLASLKIFVIDADRGTNGALYTMNTTGVSNQLNVTLAGLGCADDGAVYAAGVGSDQRFAVYRWADTDPTTRPVTIFGTNSPATNYVQFAYNPCSDLNQSTMFRFGDNLAVRGSGQNTEILLDSQNNTTFASILRPADSTMTNWTQVGFVLQNKVGSYGSSAYGTTIGRSLQFGVGNTFYQKRYNGINGSPLALMSYNPGGGLANLQTANTSPLLLTNGPVAVNPNLKLAAGINFVGGISGTTKPGPELDLYDLTDPAQAVFLSSTPLPPTDIGSNHVANGNAVAQVLFAANSTTGTNYIFVIEGNNGVGAYVLSGGAIPPPTFALQPSNLRVLEGTTNSMSAVADQVATLTWYKGTNPPVNTGTNGPTFTINNATAANAGDYFCVAANGNGVVTSTVAHVTVGFTNDNYTLAQRWGLAGGAVAYLTSNGGANTPTERAFAYNVAANQLIVVSCPPASTAYHLYVVNADTGALLYELNTNGVVHEGGSEVSGSNPIDLVGATAADDGNIYVCNESPNASGGTGLDPTKMWHLYRWTNSNPSTTPVNVFQGDPSFQPAGINERWGDVMTVRGTGTNTEIFVNSQSGSFGAILKPTDASLNTFTNFWFADSGGSGSIGRSVQFGSGLTVYEKRKGSQLIVSTYDTNLNSSIPGLQIASSSTLGGVFIDTPHSLALGVDFVGSPTATPDAVSLFDITDPNAPMFIKRYNFAQNQVANANVICQTIVSGNRAWALDANNGMVSFYIVPPVNSMRLNITPAGSNVNLSWGNAQAILQSSSSLNPQNWVDLAGPGVTNSVQPASGTTLYRLIQRL